MKVYKGHHYHSYKPHPVIRLGGSYLAKLGFKIGDTLNIEMSDGQISITKEVNTI
jgi:antitoxin component of MazEF toxin-antitoxin module